MTIQVPPAELYGLAAALHGCADTAAEVPARLPGAAVGGPVQPALVVLVEAVGAAGAHLAGELHWLGSTVGAVADAWAGLDGSLLAPRGSVAAR
ncbi:hypothetical protein [Klenkia brasiliensis]|uniref:Excreted virulence factor EspC, type VII ESX diderm n=1 Tax=Klenkia brasiliensis TaxID=333142 RepID=A0A1G7R2U4_9ACTN|nr:hypothetical protein [Klenkia brasiliensis]SDG04270.1 hypothetical protein SAMN05660324_1694 [Klenkia brasiliensis]